MATRLLIHEFTCKDFQQAIKGNIPIPADAKEIKKIVCEPIFPVDEYATAIPDPVQQYYIVENIFKPALGDASGYISFFKENNSENVLNTIYVTESSEAKIKDCEIRVNESADNSNLNFVFRKSLNYYHFQRQFDYPNKKWGNWKKGTLNNSGAGKFEVTVKIYVYYETKIA